MPNKLTFQEVEAIISSLNDNVSGLVNCYVYGGKGEPEPDVVTKCCLDSLEQSFVTIQKLRVNDCKFFGSGKRFGGIDGSGLVFDLLAAHSSVLLDPFIVAFCVKSMIKYCVDNLAIDGDAICHMHRHYHRNGMENGVYHELGYCDSLCEVLTSVKHEDIAEILMAESVKRKQLMAEAEAVKRKQLMAEAEAVKRKQQEKAEVELPNDGDDDVPGAYICSITGEIMRDPVMTICGQTYERCAITAWLLNHDTDPNTNIVLGKKPQLITNYAIKMAIAAWHEKHPTTSDNETCAPAR